MSITRRIPAILLLAMLVLLPLSEAADYKLSGIINDKIVGTSKALKSPADVYVDEANNRIFVADTYDYSVQIYYLNNLSYWRTMGGDPAASAYTSGINQPISLLYRNNNLYMADLGQNNIKRYSNDLALLGSTTTGSQTSVYNLNGVSGIEVLPNGTMYIADTFNNRILIYDSKFKYLGEFGTFGSFGDDSLYYPRGLSLSGSQLYIADSYNARVKIMTLNGTFVGTVGTGSGGITLHYPEDVYVALDGRIYVADTLNNRIVIFSSSGSPLSTISGSYGGLNITGPRGIYVDSKDNIYVADTGSNRILIFKPTGLLPAIATNASSDIALAEVELAYFNSIVAHTGALEGVSTDDMGASNYLELARTMYAEGDYAGAFTAASTARSRVAQARALLESQLHTAIDAELLSLYGRFAAFDADISANKLPLSTTQLRADAAAVNATAGVEPSTAVADLDELVQDTDAMEAEIAKRVVEAGVTKNDLTRDIGSLVDRVGDLKVRATAYRQSADTSAVDVELSQASSLLSRNLTAASDHYASAKYAFDQLNASVEASITAIIDANLSIMHARQAVAEASGTTGALAPADVNAAEALIVQAEDVLYTDPAKASELAGLATAAAQEAQRRAIASRDNATIGVVAMLALLALAIGVVYYVYRLRKSKASMPPSDSGFAKPPAYSQPAQREEMEMSGRDDSSAEQPRRAPARNAGAKPSAKRAPARRRK